MGSEMCIRDRRGSVRNIHDVNKTRLLKAAFKEKMGEIELVEADLSDEESLRQAVKGGNK